MNYQIYVPVIAALAGALIGIVGREFGVIVQNYREDKRVLKMVLFNQLDLWVEMWRTNFSFIVSSFTEEFEVALLKRGANPDQVKGLFDNLNPQLITLLGTVKIVDLQKLFDRFTEAINKLAEVDPIVAFEMNMRNTEELKEKFSELLRQAEEIDHADEKPIEDKMVLDRLVSDLHDTSNRELISSLEKDILLVSRKIGPLTWFKAWRMTKSMEGRMRESTKKSAERLIDSMVLIFSEVQGVQNQV